MTLEMLQGVAQFVFIALVWVACMIGLGARNAVDLALMTLSFFLAGVLLLGMTLLYAFAFEASL